MKKLLFFFCALFSAAALMGQSPGLINYQGVARNAAGNVLANQNIRLRLSVRDGGVTGSIVYQETRVLKTSNFGLFNVAIGGVGAVSSTGTVPGVNWGNGYGKFLQVEMDPAGGNNFVDMGTSQLLSVPYALYADAARPFGTAGGSLSGTYPNPGIAASAINTTHLADNAITTAKIEDGAITAAKLAPGVISGGGGGGPTGSAGGDLTGTFPNPTVIKLQNIPVASTTPATGQVLKFTGSKWEPAPDIGGGGPGGIASGDLSGTYPSPLVTKLQGIALSNTPPATGQILKFDGMQWIPATESGGGGGGSFSLPYIGGASVATAAMSIANNGSTANSMGIWGSHGNNGWGVYGSSAGVNGIGVKGSSDNGTGVYAVSMDGNGLFATSTNGIGGYFDIPDHGSGLPNGNDAIYVNNSSAGGAITAMSTNAWGLMSMTNSASYPSIYGINYSGGEAILGFTASDVAASVIGRNTGIYAGVRGVNEAVNGTGVLAQANVNGATDGNALVAELEAAGSGNLAVFKTNNANVARIDHTGKGFFNGGTQVGGADVAEYFDVEGMRSEYEPGDVLVISKTSDRRVAKSTTAYSTLVAGVYATKPGIYLTEENAEKNELDRMVPMGVIGVIPVKVCMEGGPIKRGDLIVTSSLRGTAMKADPDKVKVGQVLGKALQDYNGTGNGKINVLVSVK